MTIGIYSLYWEEQDLIYIGQSLNISRRFKEHRLDMCANRHTNYKVQNAYQLYGLPTFNIIEECSIDKCNTLEIFWTNEFNSLNSINGLNIIEAGQVGWGTSANNSKYSRIKILRVFSRLYNSNISQNKIATIENISLWVVQDIKSGDCHTWLKELWPEKYQKMLDRAKVRTTEKDAESFQIISDNGIILKIDVIREFCKTNSFFNDNIKSSSLNLRRLRRNERSSYRGWKLYSK